MTFPRWPGLLLPIIAATCAGAAEPHPQWVVVLATDAPVPQFGDRLFIEILDEQGNALPGCAACQRQLGANDPRAWPISFGVAAGGHKLRVRVRLFRAVLLAADGTPSGPAMIDRSVTLPPTSGDLRVGVALSMRCFGVPTDVAGKRSCDPDTGALAPEGEATRIEEAHLPTVGTWAPAASVPCAGVTPDDMVCVPGGAFLLGAPSSFSIGDALDTSPEHVVQISPFRIDREELTVKAFTDLRMLHRELGAPLKRGAVIADGAFCTYGGSDPSLPLNCVTKPLAAAICAAQGKRLPTEAEWEYAAGNEGLETTLPWGSDDDVCRYAVVARGDIDGPTKCRISAQGTLPVGPAPGGGPLDRTALGVHDLGGNLSEWVADEWVPYRGPCWSQGRSPLVDPLCTGPAVVSTVRGGNWAVVPISAHVVIRGAVEPTGPASTVGVRCASK